MLIVLIEFTLTSGLIRYSHCTGLPAIFTQSSIKIYSQRNTISETNRNDLSPGLGGRGGGVISIPPYESQKIDKMKVIKEDMKIVFYS